MGRISMPQGKGSQLHNRRDYAKIGKPVPDNINSALTAENIVLVDKNIKDAYHDIFGDAVAEYNAKQKRADRKIDDYYTHIQKSKNGEKIFYEDVLQWGAKSDFERPETRQKAAEALKAYVSTFEQRNSNLRLIGAYIHMDEASPHLHLDYIPVASGYKRGMAVRNSLDRAMKQMGYQPENESRKNNATKLWKEHERAVFGDICRDMGLEVEEERKARGSLSVEEYKNAKDAMMGDIEQEKQALMEEITPLRQLKVRIDEVDDIGKAVFSGHVLVKRDDLNLIKKQAEAYTVNRNEIKSVRQRSADVAKREKQADLREQQLKVRESDVERMLHDQQTSFNQHLKESEDQVKQLWEQNTDLKSKNCSLKDQVKQLQVQNADLKTENSSLKTKISSLKTNIDDLWDTIITLTEHFKGAIECLGAVCKAIGMFKYSDGIYRADLTIDQGHLVDAILNYGSNYARSVDEHEIADDIDQNTMISSGINREIKELKPEYWNL